MMKILSTTEAARLLGVAVGSVSNWIDAGKLKAGRTPGGHRRIQTTDLLEFVRRQGLPVPPELLRCEPRVLLVGSIRPDVVILDLAMAGLDGFEVCRRIKSREATRSIAVIAMTAFHSPEAEQRILQCGARVCLSKPLHHDVVLKELGDALSDRW